MASMTLTFPDEQANRIIDALCGLHGYDPAVNGTKGAFAKQCVINWMKHEVMRYEEQARQQAMQAAVPPVTPVDVT